MAPYDYLNQSIQSSCLILPKDNDPFFNPVKLGHTGYAFDGQLYDGGVLVTSSFGQGPYGAGTFGTGTFGPAGFFTSTLPSWFLEGQGAYRGSLATFPEAALVLLSPVALTILDETSFSLPIWMQFLLSDQYALANNFNNTLQGFRPVDVSYASGKITVQYVPDAGSGVQSTMGVTIDFTLDSVYLYVAETP